MHWLFFALSTTILYAFWGVMAKFAMRTATWGQVGLLLGICVVAVLGAVVMLRGELMGWRGGALWPAAVAGLLGAAGLATFHLALDKAAASVVVPIVGLYPVGTALLAGALLGEQFTMLKIIGLGFAVLAIIFISIGGTR